MFERVNKIDNTNKSENLNKQFVSDPFSQKKSSNKSDSISKKIELLAETNNPEIRQDDILEIVDYINSLNEQEIKILMSSNSELVRGIAARAYVDKSPEGFLDSLKMMLKDDSESTRDSAVISLCYMNSVEVLELLESATNDSVAMIRLRALTGVADIAAEHLNSYAKEILTRFVEDKNKEIREFVSDELSILE